MKTRILNLLLPTILLPFAILAQEQTGRTTRFAVPAQQEAPELTKFDFKFPGGSSSELIKAIREAMGKPVNIIVPSPQDPVFIPPFEVYDVTLPELANAVSIMGEQSQEADYRYYFRSVDKQPTDSSIYMFHVQFQKRAGPGQAQEPGQYCQYFQLAPYLEVFDVEDITTAVETGWSMLGTTPKPKLKFHKDTKLLIAVGKPNELRLIEQVLSQLKERLPKPAIDPQSGLPIPQRRITN